MSKVPAGRCEPTAHVGHLIAADKGYCSGASFARGTLSKSTVPSVRSPRSSLLLGKPIYAIADCCASDLSLTLRLRRILELDTTLRHLLGSLSDRYSTFESAQHQLGTDQGRSDNRWRTVRRLGLKTAHSIRQTYLMATVGMMAYPSRDSFHGYPQHYAMYQARPQQPQMDVAQPMHVNPYANYGVAQLQPQQQQAQQQPIPTPQQQQSRPQAYLQSSQHASPPIGSPVSEDGFKPSLPSISNLLGIADRPPQMNRKSTAVVFDEFVLTCDQLPQSFTHHHSSCNNSQIKLRRYSLLSSVTNKRRALLSPPTTSQSVPDLLCLQLLRCETTRPRKYRKIRPSHPTDPACQLSPTTLAQQSTISSLLVNVPCNCRRR